MKGNQLLKGSLIPIILKLLQDGRRMYGYEITQAVKEQTKGELQLTEGALYPALHKLEADGILATEREIVDGRARKYYRLTEKGQAETSKKLAEAQQFLNTLQLLLQPKII